LVSTGPDNTSVIPAIVGPTASGKSDLGIALALEFTNQGRPAEIINLDSVQVYRRLYIATAKVPPSDRRGIPHHLIDIADPEENFTAGEYARRAAETIRAIEARGGLPILVGGTGFYLRALVRPLFESPNTDMALRGRLRRIAQRRGPVHLHKMLFRLDPQGASSISPRNEPRTTRALEVYFQTGKRISELRPLTPDAPDFASRVRVVALNPPRDELYARINARAAEMFTRGMVEEVERLIASGIPPDAKAFQAHGYRRVVEYLRGLRTRESALEQMKLDTRHYAKRQLTWWRGWPGVSWINRFGDDPAALAEAREILLSPPSGQAV
jgi:tRNA dimethylallyltransferase